MGTKLTIVEGNSNDKDNVRVIMVKGERGYSAYEIAVQNGYTGTEEEWKDSFLNADNYYNKNETEGLVEDEGIARENADIILQNLVGKKPYYFNSVAEMKAYDLVEGDMAITTGYYEANDGGAGEYRIVTNSDVNYLQEELTNGLYANLIIENNEVNFKQIGGRPQKIDETKYDNKVYLESFISKFSNLKYKPNLYIPRGIYYFSETNINIEYSITIRGDIDLQENYGTVITSLNENQNYVWRVGNTDTFRTKKFNVLGGLTFSSGDYTYDSEYNDLHISTVKKCTSTLIFYQVTFGIFENLIFYYNDGTAFSLKSCYELHFKKLFFRACYGFNSDKMLFLENISGSNSSANTLDEIMFENCEGNLIGFEGHSNFVNNIIKSLNFEDNGSNLSNVNDGIYNDETATHLSIFNIKDSSSSSNISYITGNIIDNIYINNISTKYHTDESNNQYCYDTLLYVGGYNRVDLIINSIASQGQLKELVLIRNNKSIKPNIDSNIIFNNFGGYINLETPIKFDIFKFPTITIGNLKFSGNISNKNSLLNNQILEVFKYARKNSNTGGLICSDDDSIVDAKLCLLLLNKTINNNTTAFHIYKNQNSMTLSIHAKVPNGTTYKLRANGKDINNETSDVNNPLSMEGTGNWKWYTFNTNFENYSNNKPITFDGFLNDEDVSCLIDAVRFF